MRKIILILISILFILSSLSVFAKTNNDYESKTKNLDTFIDLGSSLPSGLYISPGAMLTYRILKKLSLGGEIKYNYNFRFGDSYLLGLGIIRFTSLYLGAGFSYRFTDGEDTKGEYYMLIPDKKLLFAFTGGLIFRPFKIGPGRLGFNGGIDIYVSSTPVKKTTGNEENVVGNTLSSIISGSITAVYNALKINFGVNYTINF